MFISFSNIMYHNLNVCFYSRLKRIFRGSNLVKSLRNIDDIIVFEVFRRGTENINPNEFQNEIKKSDFIIYGAENADRSQTNLEVLIIKTY